MMNVGHNLLHLESIFGFIYTFICQVFSFFCYQLIVPHAEKQKRGINYLLLRTINSDLDNGYLYLCAITPYGKFLTKNTQKYLVKINHENGIFVIDKNNHFNQKHSYIIFRKTKSNSFNLQFLSKLHKNLYSIMIKKATILFKSICVFFHLCQQQNVA